jgi:peptide/nickel transport system permease protein
VLAQPYIRAARARGLGEWRIAARHALPNAIHASLPLYSVQFAGLLEGTVIVESLFGRPGCGRLLVEAVLARDFPVMQGCLLILGMLCVAVTTLAQIVEVLWSPASSVEMLPLDTRPVEMQTA